MEGRDSRAESYQCQGDKCDLAVSRASGKLLCKLEVVSGMCVRVCVRACVCVRVCACVCPADALFSVHFVGTSKASCAVG